MPLSIEGIKTRQRSLSCNLMLYLLLQMYCFEVYVDLKKKIGRVESTLNPRHFMVEG